MEHFEPQRSTVAKSHFVEWFSGDALDSIWTFTQEAGTGTQQMEDVIDDGLGIDVTSTTDSDRVRIDFGDIRHYEETAFELHMVIAADSTNGAFSGMENSGADGFNGNHMLTWNNKFTSGSTDQGLSTSDGTTQTNTTTGVAITTNFQYVRVSRNSVSAKCHLGGILEVTKTTNLPTLALQPVIWAFQWGTAGTTKTKIRYLEVYNT